MNLRLSMRNRMLLVFLLIGAGVFVLMRMRHSLPGDSQSFIGGLVIGLSVAAAVVGVNMWRRATFVRRLRLSAAENNKRQE